MSRTTLTTTNHSEKSGILYMALELSKSRWNVAFHGGGQQAPRIKSVAARDWEELGGVIRKAKEKFGLPGDAAVRSCYEAGRDGFWIHRVLTDSGVENLVVDPASIEMNRRKRQAKTDRLDATKLVMQLIRHWRGEKVWSVVRVPSVQDEDERQLHRDLDQLKAERRTHRMRIQSLLFAQGIDVKVDRKLADKLDQLCLYNGTPLPTELKARIEREYARLALVESQIKELEKQQKETLEKGETTKMAKIQRMTQVRGVGITSAWVLVMELFGWRSFGNRRELGGAVGLTGTPFSSGGTTRDQGISKTGNRRVRSLLVELAWCWLRYQPDSKLSRWYQERFAGGGGRMRRVGIVALARRLVIALWKLVERGEVPEGAKLKPVR